MSGRDRCGWWREFVAGSVGGMCGVLASFPADTVKVRQQTDGASVAAVVRRTWRTMGSGGFFRGLSFPLVSAGAINSLFFGCYSCALNCLTTPVPSGDVCVFLAGCVGGAAQLLVATPVELVKIQLQTSRRVMRPLQLLRHLYCSGGVRACYHGLWPTAVRDVGSYGIYMLVYERLHNVSAGHHASPDGSRRAASIWWTMTAGGVAGTLAWWSVLPVDVLKSRIQAETIRVGGSTVGLLQCARNTLAEGGVRALAAGGGMVTVRAFVTSAFTFLGYEYALQAMH